MKVLSLFDGISCGMVALERAEIYVEKYYAYEIDKNAIKISTKNYPQIKHCGDVFKADFKKYKGFDLLIGGSPCTYWSVAQHKNRETTPNGIGGKLFMEYVRALEESECRYFLYENNYSISKEIKNFISNQLGVQPIMINSAYFSAQQRKRCYWTNIPNVQHPKDKGLAIKDILQQKTASDFSSYYFKPDRLNEYGNDNQSGRVYSVYGKSVTLSACGGGGGAKTGLYKIDFPSGEYEIRNLSCVEAERLQTLPDDYTKGISDTQRYKCIGNGWTVDVISHILKGICK